MVYSMVLLPDVFNAHYDLMLHGIELYTDFPHNVLQKRGQIVLGKIKYGWVLKDE